MSSAPVVGFCDYKTGSTTNTLRLGYAAKQLFTHLLLASHRREDRRTALQCQILRGRLSHGHGHVCFDNSPAGSLDATPARLFAPGSCAGSR